MRFVYFHLMPYPYLPDDFDEAHRYSSLTFPNRYFDREQGNALYHRYLDELEHAEALGFDGIACNEHHQSAYGIMPAPNIIAAALARRTERADILVIGNAIGLRDHPLRVAEEIAMLDHLSNGRIVSGFVRGIGWEYWAQAIDPNTSRSRFNEAHDLILKAWTTGEPFEWYGEHYEFRYVNVWPRPLQEPHPPVYIPGQGSKETMAFCAERRYTFMAVYAPTKVTKSWFDGYRSAANALGYEPDAEKIALSIPIYVAETDERAHAEARGPIEWLYHRGLMIDNLLFPPGYVSQASMRGILSSGMRPFGEYSYEELLKLGFAVVGSPDTVGEQLEALRRELGFGQLVGLHCIGDMTAEQSRTSTELFARAVMPALRRAAEPSLSGGRGGP